MNINNNCETEIKIYNLLRQIKKEKPEFYEPIKRILGYIYKTVKKEFFEIQSDNFFKIGEKDQAKNIIAAERTLFNKYIEGENGILNNLILILDKNPDYFQYFYQEIETFLEMSEKGIYSDYGIYKYVFNIYTILREYSINPDDKESFKMIVDDLSSLFITSIFDTNKHVSYVWGADRPNFHTKQDVIDFLLQIPDYKSNPKIRKEIKKVLDEINYVYEDSLLKGYKMMCDNLIEFYEEIDKLKKKGRNISPSTIDYLEEEIMSNVTNAKLFENSYKEKRRQVRFETIYYAPILLEAERYIFLKNTLTEIEEKTEIHDDILNHIKEMNPNFFEYLNKENPQQDSFITCMTIVLDSDTYYEIKSKLNDLIKASKIYEEDEKEALKLISELNSVKHKEVIDGIVMSWPENNNINKVEKPKQIIERMMKLHQTIPDAPNDEFYYKRSNSYYSKLTLKSFSERVISQIKENRTRKERELQQKAKEEAEALKLQDQEQAKKPKGLGSLFTKKNNN